MRVGGECEIWVLIFLHWEFWYWFGFLVFKSAKFGV